MPTNYPVVDNGGFATSVYFIGGEAVVYKKQSRFTSTVLDVVLGDFPAKSATPDGTLVILWLRK